MNKKKQVRTESLVAHNILILFFFFKSILLEQRSEESNAKQRKQQSRQEDFLIRNCFGFGIRTGKNKYNLQLNFCTLTRT